MPNQVDFSEDMMEADDEQNPFLAILMRALSGSAEKSLPIGEYKAGQVGGAMKDSLSGFLRSIPKELRGSIMDTVLSQANVPIGGSVLSPEFSGDKRGLLLKSKLGDFRMGSDTRGDPGIPRAYMASLTRRF